MSLKLRVAIAAAVAAIGVGHTSAHATAINSGSSNLVIKGVVSGAGVYQNASVCIDTNANARCDSNEPSVVTNGKGEFSLPVNGQSAGAVIAQIKVGTTLFNNAPVTQALVFRAPAQANAVVSAISTELQAEIDSGADFTTARAQLASRVGVVPEKLLEDFRNEGDTAVIAALNNETTLASIRIADAVADAGAAGNLITALRNRLALDAVQTVVVIYAENRSFDNLYGFFPGANGLRTAAAKIKQIDRDGSPLAALPPAWGNLTAAGQAPVVTQAQTTGVWANAAFQIDDPTALSKYGYAPVPQSEITRDLYHRFFENQMQINNGKNDSFAAWGDSGGTVMGYFDGSKMALWNIAKQYTLADNFFQGAFGGSFLNHQYLICACAPEYPNANNPSTGAHPTIAALNTDHNGNYLPFLTLAATSPTSALSGPPSFVSSGNIAPLNYFGDNTYRAVNTMQPPYQPSANTAAVTDTTMLFANPAAATTLPPQTQINIGDQLTAKGINWAWYTGSWNAVSTAATSAGHVIPPAPNFQFHHQPFNYFAELDPVKHPAERANHLKDRSDLVAQAQAGTLPAVVFYKPQGSVNQHPGYTDVTSGDNEIAGLISTLQQSPQWQHMLVVVTYDEFGGQFDHVAPPKGDLIGPGTRIPALIVSPFAKKGFVDHTQYDTASILRFITHRYSLTPLDGLNARDDALLANGGKRMGYLGTALNFNQ
ncbi:MAG: acid phosphatase [Verrucomicrobiaceae bacterium]|nr:acid phosphatase [Verrucomicrobiaceae bacterium]